MNSVENVSRDAKRQAMLDMKMNNRSADPAKNAMVE